MILTKSMPLKEKMTSDLKDAMKRGDGAVVSVLRMVISAFRNKEIEKHIKSLSDDDALQVLRTEARKRKESQASFEQGNRPELAEKEKQELALIKQYLPEEASEEEIRRAVQDAIAKTGATSAKDMGKVMGVVMGSLKDRADGNVVQGVVKETLGEVFEQSGKKQKEGVSI